MLLLLRNALPLLFISNVAAAYEVDGWQRGFDVEFNGVGGRIEVRENDDSSDWESDVSDNEVENRPEGYSALASEPPPQPSDQSSTASDDKSRGELTDQVRSSFLTFSFCFIIRMLSKLEINEGLRRRCQLSSLLL